MKKLIKRIRQFFGIKTKQEKIEERLDANMVKNFKILAGITPHNRNKGVNEIMDLFGNRKPDASGRVIIDEHNRLKMVENKEEVIRERKERLEEIEFESLPISRVTSETRKKIIQLVREDIAQQMKDRPEIPSINYAINNPMGGSKIDTLSGYGMGE